MNKMTDILTVRYAQTGKSTAPNNMGMREMQARAYEKRDAQRSEEHTSELQSHHDLVCRLLLEKKK